MYHFEQFLREILAGDALLDRLLAAKSLRFLLKPTGFLFFDPYHHIELEITHAILDKFHQCLSQDQQLIVTSSDLRKANDSTIYMVVYQKSETALVLNDKIELLISTMLRSPLNILVVARDESAKQVVLKTIEKQIQGLYYDSINDEALKEMYSFHGIEDRYSALKSYCEQRKHFYQRLVLELQALPKCWELLSARDIPYLVFCKNDSPQSALRYLSGHSDFLSQSTGIDLIWHQVNDQAPILLELNNHSCMDLNKGMELSISGEMWLKSYEAYQHPSFQLSQMELLPQEKIVPMEAELSTVLDMTQAYQTIVESDHSSIEIQAHEPIETNHSSGHITLSQNTHTHKGFVRSDTVLYSSYFEDSSEDQAVSNSEYSSLHQDEPIIDTSSKVIQEPLKQQVQNQIPMTSIISIQDVSIQEQSQPYISDTEEYAPEQAINNAEAEDQDLEASQFTSFSEMNAYQASVNIDQPVAQGFETEAVNPLVLNPLKLKSNAVNPIVTELDSTASRLLEESFNAEEVTDFHDEASEVKPQEDFDDDDDDGKKKQTILDISYAELQQRLINEEETSVMAMDQSFDIDENELTAPLTIDQKLSILPSSKQAQGDDQSQSENGLRTIKSDPPAPYSFNAYVQNKEEEDSTRIREVIPTINQAQYQTPLQQAPIKPLLPPTKPIPLKPEILKNTMQPQKANDDFDDFNDFNEKTDYQAPPIHQPNLPKSSQHYQTAYPSHPSSIQINQPQQIPQQIMGTYQNQIPIVHPAHPSHTIPPMTQVQHINQSSIPHHNQMSSFYPLGTPEQTNSVQYSSAANFPLGADQDVQSSGFPKKRSFSDILKNPIKPK